MPTPFYHLDLAVDLLDAEELPGHVRSLLRAQRAAFFLGNTAPDLQTISGQAREVTHFFEVPVLTNSPAPWQQIQQVYPYLSYPLRLDSEQAAFWAGYLCHLQADWFWVRDLYQPIFGPQQHWGTQEERIILHNVLRAYLDRQILLNLPADIGFCLANVQPGTWLPFASQYSLSHWRDFLSAQLKPGGFVRTVEVFARKAGVSIEQFRQWLDPEAKMTREVFAHLPQHKLVNYGAVLRKENIKLLSEYFSS